MALYLIDTSVLIRAAEPQATRHAVAAAAVPRLVARSHSCFLTPQVVTEFWAVVTRPRAANGLGWTVARACEAVDSLLRQLPLLGERPRIFPFWRSLVTAHGVMGKRVHDARLAAVMHVHGVTHLLTFNVADFADFADFGVVVLSPADIT